MVLGDHMPSRRLPCYDSLLYDDDDDDDDV